MFPDNDPRNAGRDSVEMLGEAVRRVRTKGFAVAQADVTIVLESPRLEGHKGTMRSTLAQALGLDASAVTVKAKTNEGLGWIGRGEGIACFAVATLVHA
jgi:2-C-methyl-D-erythritol 2,4-cyclodiphosphate synthase